MRYRPQACLRCRLHSRAPVSPSQLHLGGGFARTALARGNPAHGALFLLGLARPDRFPILALHYLSRNDATLLHLADEAQLRRHSHPRSRKPRNRRRFSVAIVFPHSAPAGHACADDYGPSLAFSWLGTSLSSAHFLGNSRISALRVLPNKFLSPASCFASVSMWHPGVLIFLLLSRFSLPACALGGERLRRPRDFRALIAIPSETCARRGSNAQPRLRRPSLYPVELRAQRAAV